MKNILQGHITTKIFASNGESPFFGKNGQKGRHGCVRSEHVLQDQKQNLVPKNILSPKKFWLKKFVGQILFFRFKQLLGLKKILGHKKKDCQVRLAYIR